MEEKQKSEQALQELDLLDAGRKQQEEAVRRKEAEISEAMDIPPKYWLTPETSPREENVKRQINLTEQTLSHRQNLPDRELVRWASGGLALQGIYKSSSQRDLLEQREQLLSVPEEFSFFGPEQGTQMETKEFTSSQAESNFTQTIGKLGFTISTLDKCNGWGISLEAKGDLSKQSESMETKKSCSEHSYFCSTKFMYVPLVSCHFSIDQLQFSKAALQELKYIEDLLDHPRCPDIIEIVRRRTKKFFQRFGSHANQGPLHLGGIYWWKAVSQDFQSEQLEEVKQQSAEMLDAYIRGSYSGISLTSTIGVDVSSSHSNTACQNTASRNFQNRIQLSMVQTGGPIETNSVIQWKAGLVASNQTWCVIDRGLQLVPIWDIILSNHRSDFKNPLLVANSLVDSYNYLTGFNAQIQEGEDLLRAQDEVRDFLETMKSWEVSNPKEQLKQLMGFVQILREREKSRDVWISICLPYRHLHKFLVNIVNFCKTSYIYISQFMCQMHSLLDLLIYSMKNILQKHFIIKWFSQRESVLEDINITQFCELMKKLKEAQSHLMEAETKSLTLEIMEEAQRKATCKVSMYLSCFLNYLQETEQADTQLLLLSIAASAGYNVANNTFQCLLGREELNYLLHEMQTAYDKHQKLQNICSYKAQAFLVLTGLTATAGVTVVSPEEKTQRLALIRQYIGHLLTTEVARSLSKLVTLDWENQEKDLRLLINGDDVATMSSIQMNDVKKVQQSLPDEMNPSSEVYDTDNCMFTVEKNRNLLELLQRLGLKDKYPKRMTKAELHLIYKISVHNSRPSNEQELPFYFLQKLLMLDYGLRYLVSSNDQEIESQVSADRLSQDNQSFDPFENNFEEKGSTISGTILKPHIHPMDVQMTILYCADNFARQYILGKLSTCQFALPLLVPNPCNSQIEFYLWSLSQIRRSWQQRKKSPNHISNFNNQQMCRVPTPIVSFIRVGNDLSASKSYIMNCLLSKRKHDIFFHRHSKGSSRDCLLMGGVVEIFWFCPTGEEEERFDRCLTFANLHGNAKEYPQQLTFLQEVSSVLVILMATTDDNEENRKCVRHLCQLSKPFILLHDDKETMANISGQRVKIGIRNRNEAELTKELSTTIEHLIKYSNSSQSLEDCAHIAQKYRFLIDEEEKDCKIAKEKAKVLISILQGMDITQMKENLLPLQGQLWHDWCRKDKELYHLREKGNRSIEQHRSETETEKKSIRHEQLERAFPLNELIKYFLEFLLTHSETHTNLYFLQWLGVLLEKLTTPYLESLKEKKKSLWSQIQTEKYKSPKGDVWKHLENDVQAISKKISDCNLGIEQILREVGQIYEALEENAFFQNREIYCPSLPQIAADLMISGVPIELMDGEASYVPVKWVAAVFDKVIEKLGDKRLFVLSILGIQSSGKSTLLNALFGLQFTVSAGRCTCGAYMQLLKVEEAFAEELGFDFLLVVDTEGLRAPELCNKSQNHDNELATFVVGLGNLTLINIFGENPSEMQDILQIVVQAFLRMKQVKINPSCLFVHQNVGEVTAKDQTMEGRRRLEQRLDEMAAAAAEHEQCSDINFFNDVIKFDVSTQVHYFAHLWDGNPPMAPPNPHYSLNVQELKCQVLETAKQQSRRSIMKISNVKMRVQDLWKALLSENFIFSFRNTQEVLAMSKLESMYNCWTWDLRHHILGLHDQIMNQVQNGKLQTLTPNMLETQISKTYKDIKQKMEKYFKDDSDSEILIQWKVSFENKLSNLKEALISDVQRKGEEMIYLKRNQEKMDSKKSTYEKEIVKKSQDLALILKGQEMSDEKLYQRFNQLWETWVYDVTSKHQPIKDPDIDKDFEDILFQHFIKKNNIVDIINQQCGESFQINYDKHVQMKRKYLMPLKLEVQDKESIDVTTGHIVSRFNQTIDRILKQGTDYHSYYFHEILRIVEDEVASALTQERYTFKTEYKIDLALILFKKASKTFKEMHRAFKEANDPVNYLNRKKDEFFTCFKISCEGASNIKMSVDFLWQKLIPAVSTTLWRRVVCQMAGYIRENCPKFNANRSNLEKYILISLAEEENFDNYWQYLHDPRSFFKRFIESHVQQYYSGKESRIMKSFLKQILDNIKEIIRSAIYHSTEIAQDKNSNKTISEWLNLFCDHLGNDFTFPRKDLISIEHQEIKDLDFLKGAMSDALDHAMKDLEQKCLNTNEEKVMLEISEILSEHLCGCWKQCPFCGAICTNTISTHDGEHSVPFHRPPCVQGGKWYKTDHFAIDFCTSLVASDIFFILEDKRKFPFKTYRQAGGVYATWNITPDSSTQPYWKWFACHFRSQLEKKYQLKFEGRGQIPNTWYNITKQNVLDDLRKQ